MLGIFFGSRTSKYVWESRGRTVTDEELPERGAQVLEMIRKTGRTTNRDVAFALRVSPASAKRILADLVAQGQIRLVGEKRGTYYVLSQEEKPADKITPEDKTP